MFSWENKRLQEECHIQESGADCVHYNEEKVQGRGEKYQLTSGCITTKHHQDIDVTFT